MIVYIDNAVFRPSKMKLVLFLPEASPDEKSKPTRLGRTFRSLNPWFYPVKAVKIPKKLHRDNWPMRDEQSGCQIAVKFGTINLC